MFYFSIIIPTYNDLINLKKCLRSVYRQDFLDYELIIVNDGSTDGTYEFLNSLNKENISVYNLKENNGPAHARNIGIKNSRGAWVCFLDSDDFWIKSKLKITLKNIKLNENYDVFCHNQIRKEKLTRKIKKLYTGPYKAKFYNNLILEGNCLITSATVVRNDFLIKNSIFFRTDKKYYSVEDYDFWLNLAFNDAKFFFIKDFLGFYYIHKNNITTNIMKHKKNYLSLLYNHVFKIQKFEFNKFKLWKKIYCKYLIEIIIINLFYINNFKKGALLFFYALKKFNLLFILNIFHYFIVKFKNLFNRT